MKSPGNLVMKATPGARVAVPRKRFERIVVATDGTAAGKRAVTYAIELALEHGATLELCSVVDSSAAIAGTSLSGGVDGTQIARIMEDAARTILEDANAETLGAKIVSATSILYGHADEAIVTFAAKNHADAIVIGTRGTRGIERFFLGSTAWDVLRASTIPTIVVPPNLAPHSKFYRILVALDSSKASDATLQFAMRLASAERSMLVLCSIVDTRDPYNAAATYGFDSTTLLAELHKASNELIHHHAAVVELHDLPHQIATPEGPAAESILHVARQHDVDAIVIGTHGRRGVGRLFLGSVAEAVVRESTVPVAVVHTKREHVSHDALPVGPTMG